MSTHTADNVISPETIALATQNFILHEQFAQAMLNDEALADEIPRGAVLVLLPDHHDELRDANLRAGLDAIQRGQNVYFRHVYQTDAPADQYGGLTYAPNPPASSPKP